VYQNLVKEFTAPSEDDLKEYMIKHSKFRKNVFSQAFLHISEAMVTRSAYIRGTISHARNPSTTSDLSTSSNENADEETLRQIIGLIIGPIISYEDRIIMSNNVLYRLML
jgi:hypothetical protein